MEETEIRLITDDDGIFEPDRISGKREDIEKLGIEVIGEESTHSYMWDFECVDIRVPDRTFMVKLHFKEEDDGYGDILFDTFGIGYAEREDFEIVSGYNPFKEWKSAGS
jgi:hypothetical protein